MLGIVRPIIRPLVYRSSKFPIETIVATFVFTTLAYFHIVNAIKHSTFLAPPSITHTFLPVHAFRAIGSNSWFTVFPDKESPVAELLQVVFKFPQSNVSHTSSKDSIDNVTQSLIHDFQTDAGQTYARSLCYKVDGECFMLEQPGSLTLAFKAGSREAWSSALHRAALPLDSSMTRFQVEPIQTGGIGEMRSGKWVAYAARALVVRVWDLTKVCANNILTDPSLLTLTLASRQCRHSRRLARLYPYAWNFH